MGRRVCRKATNGVVKVGDVITIDGESWRVVALSPLVMRRCGDGRIGIGNKHRGKNGEA